MEDVNIDYEALKKRGFLRQRQEGFFILRIRHVRGIFSAEQLDKITEIARKFSNGFVHPTTRQGIEVPFIKFNQIGQVERELNAVGLETGTSGARLRTTTLCPGNNWCKQGLIDTFTLSERIEKESGLRCGMDLPHKFKIAISGCPNTCTRPQASEIGIHGVVDPVSGEKRIGFAVYLGGCGGKAPRSGFKLEKIFTEDDLLSLVGRVVEFYKQHAAPRQRLGVLIEQYGREKFLKEVVM